MFCELLALRGCDTCSLYRRDALERSELGWPTFLSWRVGVQSTPLDDLDSRMMDFGRCGVFGFLQIPSRGEADMRTDAL